MPATMTETAISTIRAEIARRKISQSRLARDLGMSRTALSRRMNGDLPLTLDTIEAIADLLDIPAMKLLGNDGQI